MNEDNKKRKLYNIMLVLFIGCLIFMNIVRISGDFFWGDECFSIRLSKESFAGMLSETAADVHPPLYYFILQIFYKIMGESGLMYHMVSLIPYGLLMIFAMTVVRKRFGIIATLIYSSFASITSTALLYNNQVRMYSWSAFFVLLAFYYAYRIMEENRWKDWIIFSACSLSAGYTHYYALLAVAFFYLAFLIISFFQKRYIKKLLIISICTVIGYFPWLFVFISTFRRTTKSWWLQGIPGLKDCVLFFFESNIISIAVILIFILFFLQKIGSISRKSQNKSFVRTDIINIREHKRIVSNVDLWMIMGFGSAVGMILSGEVVSHLVQPVFMVRYLFPISSVIWLLLGIMISRLDLRYLYSVLIMILLLTTCIPAYGKLYIKENELNKDTADFQKQVTVSTEDIIVTDIDHMDWTILDYYYPGVKHQLISMDDLPGERLQSGNEKLWIFSSETLSQDKITAIKMKNLKCIKCYSGRLGINQKIEVYCIIKRGDMK